MRKLKLQVQITANGFIAGPTGGLDWATFNWDQDLKDYVAGLTHDVDCILLGRKLAEGFIPYWNSHPQEEGAPIFINTPKIVFSKTLTQSPWPGTTINNDDLAQAVLSLKRQPGKNLIAYGGAGFVSSLVKLNAVDEYHLFVNPAVIPAGLTIFGDLQAKLSLRLLQATPFACGITVLKYAPESPD